MAGNIVAAICSTNAIAAAIQVNEAFQLIQKKISKTSQSSKELYITN